MPRAVIIEMEEQRGGVGAVLGECAAMRLGGVFWEGVRGGVWGAKGGGREGVHRGYIRDA